jgi:high-affinity Fe2+/Pb2+ permease
MWAVPVLMFVAALLFAVIAASDGRWALVVMMVFMALIAVGLFSLHWWVMRGMGRTERRNDGGSKNG